MKNPGRAVELFHDHLVVHGPTVGVLPRPVEVHHVGDGLFLCVGTCARLDAREEAEAWIIETLQRGLVVDVYVDTPILTA